MAGNWTLGTPPVRKTFSADCDVTDGTREARARYQVGSKPGQRGRWVGEDGQPLEWQVTHWRPATAKAPVDTFSLD